MTSPALAIALYYRLIDAWNHLDAAGMAACFAPEGTMNRFDGSTETGPDAIRETCPLGSDFALLRAIVGMVPPGDGDIIPAANASQSLVASRHGDAWLVELFQNTPAAYHGRPNEQDAHSAASRAALRKIGSPRA
jgi:hypothetical protein